MQEKSPGKRQSRGELLESLDRQMRQASGLGVMFSQAVANRLGLTPTELESLDLLATNERVTAGDLARATGLTTGAVTGMIDRLERAGYARRERDAADRRRVYVQITPKAMELAGPYYESLGASVARVLESYSDAEIALLVDYFTRARQVMNEEIERLAADNAPKKRRRAGLRSPRP